MTDELYDYFGGNASKKVEPIEDDDLDLETENENSIDVDQSVTSVGADPESEGEVAEGEVEAETAKGGHWDFLANMLGISSSKPAAAKPKATSKKEPKRRGRKPETTPVSKAPTPDPIETASETPASTESGENDFLGLDAIPSPEKSTVLPSMFAAPVEDAKAESVEATDDLIGWNPRPRKSFTVKPEQTADAPVESIEEVPYEEDYEEIEALDGEEFVEFEIEELDISPRDEKQEAAHGRRRRKPAARPDPVEPDRESVERPKSDRSRSPRTRTSRSSSKDDRSKEDRPERQRAPSGRGRQSESRDRNEPKTEESRSGRRPRRSRSGRDDNAGRDEKPRRNASSPARNAQRDDVQRDELRDEETVFGAGLVDVDWESDVDEQAKKPQGRTERNKSDQPDADSTEGSGRGRKRRRRRGSKSRTERGVEEVRDAKPETGFGAGILDDDAEFESISDDDSFDDSMDANDVDRDDVAIDGGDDTDDRPRKRSRSRRRKPSTRSDSQGSQRDRNDDENDDDDDDEPIDGERKRAKVPTWNETITVLIESNIKNHKRTSGSRRSGGGGRGRSGSGGEREGGNPSAGESRGESGRSRRGSSGGSRGRR